MRFGIIVQKHNHIAGAILDSLPDWWNKPRLVDRDEAQKIAVWEVQEPVQRLNRFAIVVPMHHHDLIRNVCLPENGTHGSFKISWPLKGRDRDRKPKFNFGIA
jgi:hypothetical protein